MPFFNVLVHSEQYLLGSMSGQKMNLSSPARVNSWFAQ